MLLLGDGKKAMSAVLSLTDGKPSFLCNAYEKVLQLKDTPYSSILASKVA